MYNKAIDKIRDEMAANANDGYIAAVGEYLTEYIRGHKDEADKVMADGKTIKGSLAAASEEARKKQRGNVAVLSYEEVYKLVREYYGFCDNRAKNANICGFDLDLDELLD